MVFTRFSPQEKKAINPSPVPVQFPQTANSTSVDTNFNTGKEVLGGAKTVGKFAASIPQGFARDIATLPSVIANQPDAKIDPKKFGNPTLGNVVFGTYDEFSARSEAVSNLTPFGVSEEKAGSIGPVAIGALTATDLVGKPFKRVLGGIFSSFKKTNKINVDDIYDLERRYTLDKPPSIADDEELVYFQRTDGDKQYIATTREQAELQAADPTKIEVGVVKKGDIEPTVFSEKNREGLGLLPREKADEIIRANRILPERKFIERLNKAFPDQQNKIGGQYVPRSTDKLAIAARQVIKEDLKTAERIVRTQADDNAVAVASELLNKYARQADEATDPALKSALYDKAASIAEEIAPKLTEAGRTIQAASIFGRLTPEGQLRLAARQIDLYNSTIPNPAKHKTLTGENARHIAEEQTAIMQMPDGIEKAMRQQRLSRYIADLVPSPFFEKVAATWKAGLLTGIKTSGLNIGTSASHLLSETIKDIPATGVDSVASLFTGKKTVSLPFSQAQLKQAFSGLGDGTIKGKRYFFSGFDEREIGKKIDYKHVNFGKGKVGKTFQFYTDTVFRTIGSQDQPFYYAAYARSMMDQAIATAKNEGVPRAQRLTRAYQLVEDPTEEMIRYATLDASTAVFINKTGLGEAAAKIQRLPVVGQFILPFARTPSAVAMQILNYSPVGAVKTIVENIGKGRFDQRLFSQGIGRSITGTAPLFIGYKLYENGLITLDYPGGDERSIELNQAEGVAYNSVKVGSNWRNVISLGPAGNLLLLGAHFRRSIEDAGSPSEAWAMAAGGALKSFTEQTFLTGLKNFIDGVTDPVRYGKTFLPNLISSFVPTIVSDVARANDPLERRSSGVIERVQSRIPVARNELEPRVDALGNAVERPAGPIASMVDPTRPSQDISTPVTQELRRLMIEGYRVAPTKLGDREGYDVLTDAQNTALWQTTGEIINTKLYSLFESPKYQTLPDDEKAKVIEKFVQEAKDYGRAVTVIDATRDLTGQELKDELKRLKEGKLLTRDVFRKYTELR